SYAAPQSAGGEQNGRQRHRQRHCKRQEKRENSRNRYQAAGGSLFSRRQNRNEASGCGREEASDRSEKFWAHLFGRSFYRRGNAHADDVAPRTRLASRRQHHLRRSPLQRPTPASCRAIGGKSLSLFLSLV